MTEAAQAPAADDLEISLFGATTGECLVLHLGGNEWIVVDSFRDPATEMPVALAYLDALGVEPSRIRLVVATHWHDDHIDGIADVVSASPDAEFVWSAALRDPQFFRILTLAEEYIEGPFSSGAAEFLRIVQHRSRRTRASSYRFVRQTLADENKILLRLPSGPRPTAVRVYSLSPSSVTIANSYRYIGRALASPGVRIPDIGNHGSIVLLVEAGATSVLLGADLEETGVAGEGWSGLAAGCKVLSQRASIFKVPHHGSPNGDHPVIWKNLVTTRPSLLLTPFGGGRKPRPDTSDLDRLCAKASQVWQAGLGRSIPPPRSSTVERIMSETVRDRRSWQSAVGHVRIRLSMSTGKVRTETFGSAGPKCNTTGAGVSEAFTRGDMAMPSDDNQSDNQSGGLSSTPAS